MEMSVDPIFMIILEREMQKDENYTLQDLLKSPLQEDTAISAFFLVLMIISSFVGIIGNTLVISAVCVSKKLRTTGNYLIVNLAIADIMVVLIVQPFNVVGLVDGAGIFVRNMWLCHLISVLCVIACVCSMMTLAAIAVNRYIMINRYWAYNDIYTPKKTVFICLGLWCFAFIIDLPNFAGWGMHTFDLKSYGCSFDRQAGLGYILFLSIIALWIPLGVILFCYLKIYLKVRKSRKNTDTTTAMTKKAKKEAKRKNDQVNLARTFFIVFVSFLICWTPFDLLLFIDMQDKLPAWVYLLTLQIGHFNSSLNSILYGATNKRFWDGYKLVLSKLICLRRTQLEKLAVVESTNDSLSNSKDSMSPAVSRSTNKTLSTQLSSSSNMLFSVKNGKL